MRIKHVGTVARRNFVGRRAGINKQVQITSYSVCIGDLHTAFQIGERFFGSAIPGGGRFKGSCDGAEGGIYSGLIYEEYVAGVALNGRGLSVIFDVAVIGGGFIEFTWLDVDVKIGNGCGICSLDCTISGNELGYECGGGLG